MTKEASPRLVHEWKEEGLVITFTWLGDVEVQPDRVYALAFTPDRKMLLVTNEQWSPLGWLPGGGIGQDETPEEALERELMEEASALVQQRRRLGFQHAKDSLGGEAHQVFYWCRITGGAKFQAQEEGIECFLVDPEEFLDKLFWGRADPKGEMLLEKALEIERTHE